MFRFYSRVAVLAALGSSLVASHAAAQYQYDPGPGYYRNDTAEGTVVGGGFGAIAGALIGDSKGKSTEGALIGAVTGALAGNLLGRSQDRADQQYANAGYAATAQANAQAAALAVTNYDLAQMTRAGLDESVIIGAIQSRGGRFDLTPAGLIALKQSGVSNRVVLVAQQTSNAGIVLPQRATTYHRAPQVHYYAPPTVYYHDDYYYGGHHGPYCHGW